MLDLAKHPHRRYNPLTAEWTLVSPQRTRRPWQGQVEKVSEALQQVYDPNCYLCPGNTRAEGRRNPPYTGTFVFENDFAALLPGTPVEDINQSGLIVAAGEPGLCRVICFTPRHDLTLSRMELPEIRILIDTWAEQFCELAGMPWIHHVQIFENRGAMMGASNPHPHCQLWANANLPNEVRKELDAQSEYRASRGTCLLCDYLRLEQEEKERLVIENEHFIALAPFWAVWPFETLMLSRRHLSGLDGLSGEERDGLAAILKRMTTRYDNLFEVSFPYTMGLHQRPTDGRDHPEWHFHLHFYPPLLRSATIRKFMVGYEMLATPQRDITVESAAARLREVSDRHS